MSDSWRSRIKCLGLHSNLTWNTIKLDYCMSYHPGGTGVVLSYTIASRVISIGNDKRGLGRWAWTRL